MKEMSAAVVLEIAKQAEMLSPEDQLYLIVLLTGKAQRACRSNGQSRQWREIRGAAPFPLVGEDAQAWVARNRRDDDTRREQRWRVTA